MVDLQYVRVWNILPFTLGRRFYSVAQPNLMNQKEVSTNIALKTPHKEQQAS